MVTLAPAASYEQNALRRLYLDAFPRAERKPFRLLCRQARRGRMELLTLRGEAGEPLGLAVTMLHESLVLLDYFAVAPAARGGGIGGEALGLLRERYAGRRFFLEIEALGEPDTPPEQETLRAAQSLLPAQRDARAGRARLHFRAADGTADRRRPAGDRRRIPRRLPPRRRTAGRAAHPPADHRIETKTPFRIQKQRALQNRLFCAAAANESPKQGAKNS